jgi:hypothetical protein
VLPGRVGDVRHHKERDLRGDDVAEQRRGHPHDLGHFVAAEVVARVPAEPHPAQERDQRHRLHHDAERGAEPE